MNPISRLYYRIALVNPNTNTSTTSRMVEIAGAAVGPEVEVVGITTPFGEPLITNPSALAIARDGVLSLPASVFENVSGVIVAAFGDPGADELRARLTVPVAGIAEASMRAAAEIGRFSVVTTTPLLAGAIRKRGDTLGLADRLASVRTSNGDPAALMGDELALRAEPARLIEMAVAADGAEAIIIGGGPLATAARALSGSSRVPLIEPIPVAAYGIMDRLTSPGDRG
jgi:allantoin racemase